jgi:quercetin dioxygenase-like cupin family protein
MPVVKGFETLETLPVETIGEKFSRRVVSGEKCMIVRVSARSGAHAAAHEHPHEQIVFVISGRMEFRIGDETRTMRAGDVAVIPGGAEHEARFPEDTELIDFFAPRREDFLAGGPPAYMQR